MYFRRNFNVYGYKIDFYQTGTGNYVYVNGIRVKSGMLPPFRVYKYVEDADVTIKIDHKYSGVLKLSGKLDVYINDQLVAKDVALKFSFGSRKEHENTLKQKAFELMKMYDLQEAIDKYKEAQSLDPDDYDIDFRLACCYSLAEDSENCKNHMQRFRRKAHQPQFRIDREEHLAWYRTYLQQA